MRFGVFRQPSAHDLYGAADDIYGADSKSFSGAHHFKATLSRAVRLLNELASTLSELEHAFPTTEPNTPAADEYR